MQNLIEITNHHLVRQDIEGFIQAGAPEDEYLSEAKAIAEAVLGLGDIQLDTDKIISCISIIWMEAFGLDEVELQDRLPSIQLVAQEIFKIIKP